LKTLIGIFLTIVLTGCSGLVNSITFPASDKTVTIKVQNIESITHNKVDNKIVIRMISGIEYITDNDSWLAEKAKYIMGFSSDK